MHLSLAEGGGGASPNSCDLFPSPEPFPPCHPSFALKLFNHFSQDNMLSASFLSNPVHNDSDVDINDAAMTEILLHNFIPPSANPLKPSDNLPDFPSDND